MTQPKDNKCGCSSHTGSFEDFGPDSSPTLEITQRKNAEDFPGEVIEATCRVCGKRWQIIYDAMGYHRPGYYWNAAPGEG